MTKTVSFRDHKFVNYGCCDVLIVLKLFLYQSCTPIYTVPVILFDRRGEYNKLILIKQCQKRKRQKDKTTG